jgi:hypothetical protein
VGVLEHTKWSTVCGLMLIWLKRKVKLSLCLVNLTTRHEDVWGSGGIAPPFLALWLDGGEWPTSHPFRFTPTERAPDIHWIGGRVGPRAGLDAVNRKMSTLGIEHPPSSPLPVAIPTEPCRLQVAMYVRLYFKACRLYIYKFIQGTIPRL